MHRSSHPPPAEQHYVYAVKDVTKDPPTLAAVVLSRRDGRDFIQARQDAGDPTAKSLRVRRARLTLFER